MDGNSGTLFAEERRGAILARLRETGKVTVEELCETFRVSAATVRADLARLEEQGTLRRTHGGAILRSSTLFEPPYAERQVLRLAEKRLIAREAAHLVKDGETILLDAGTTAHELALGLKDRTALTVVTNSLANVLALMDSPGVQVIVVGGALHAKRRATLGPLAASFLGQFHVDRAFMAFNGVHPVAGFTVVDFEAASVKASMMAAAAETIVLADSSKVGQIAFASAAPLSAADLLVTDPGIGEADRAAIVEKGLRVRVASRT